MASSSSSPTSVKPISLFVPLADVRNLIHARKNRCAAQSAAVDAHGLQVARDVTRLMMAANAHDASGNTVRHLVRKLLILHLGSPHVEVWGSFYAAPELTQLTQDNRVVPVWSNTSEAPATHDPPALVPAEFWVHLWEFIKFDYAPPNTSDTVHFAGGDSELEGDRTRVPQMPLFARVYRLVTQQHNVAHEDVPFVFFVASALRHKNGLDVLAMAHTGGAAVHAEVSSAQDAAALAAHNIDMQHARLQKLSLAQVHHLWADLGNMQFDQDKSASHTRRQFISDWSDLINWLHVRLPETVGLVQLEGDGAVHLESTQSALDYHAETETETTTTTATSETPATEGDAEAASLDEGAAPASSDQETPIVAAADKAVEPQQARIGVARQRLEEHPYTCSARRAWRLDVDKMEPSRLGAMLVARQVAFTREERAALLGQHANFAQPETLHTTLETRSAIDDSMVDAKHWHAFVGALATLADAHRTADMEAFDRAVYSASGVAPSEKPVASTERTARYLTVYANGAPTSDSHAWRDLWLGNGSTWSLSPALERAVKQHVALVPDVPLATQQALVRSVGCHVGGKKKSTHYHRR